MILKLLSEIIDDKRNVSRGGFFRGQHHMIVFTRERHV